MSFPKAKKRFGQNFLNDQLVINEITNVINVQQDDIILEIGPGTGALTKNIIPLCKEITLIEIDFGLAMLLKKKLPEQQRINILNIDALDFNPSEFMKNSRFRLVGNLPYNISTPLIFHFLSFSPTVIDMHLMLQKEVVDRIIAQPGQKNYGRLSIMAQYKCDVYKLLDVAASSFQPMPRVQSAFVRLVPNSKKSSKALDEKLLKTLVTQCFSKRRKILKNSLKSYLDNGIELDKIVDLSLRPENISIEEFVGLANKINEWEINNLTKNKDKKFEQI